MQSRVSSFFFGVVIALVLFGTADLTLRLFESRLSGNMAATKSFPRQIAELSQAEGTTAVAIGNSLLGDALDLTIFGTNWSTHGPTDSVTAIKLVPDGSSIWDWYCIATYGIGAPSTAPDLTILGFAWDQLADQTQLNITRSFNALCPLESMAAIRAISGQVGANDWLEMITVKVSKLYAQREALRHRALGAFVPAYQDITQTMNDRAGLVEVPHDSTAAIAETRNYSALKSILDALDSLGSRVVLVAMPVMGAYEIDPELCDLVQSMGHVVLDMRRVVPPSSDYFRDSLHMNREGSRLFSQALAAEIRSPAKPSMRCRA